MVYSNQVQIAVKPLRALRKAIEQDDSAAPARAAGRKNVPWSDTAIRDRAAREPRHGRTSSSMAGSVPSNNRDGAVGKDRTQHDRGSGAVQSSAWDLTKWMRFHLANGMYDGRRLVREAAMEEMHSPQITVPAPAAFRAARQVEFSLIWVGFHVWDYRGRVMLWHSGRGNGQFAYMALLPKEKLGVVVLINSWRAPILHGALASRVLDHYLGLLPRDTVGDALAQ